jgi:hypothetical protein
MARCYFSFFHEQERMVLCILTKYCIRQIRFPFVWRDLKPFIQKVKRAAAEFLELPRYDRGSTWATEAPHGRKGCDSNLAGISALCEMMKTSSIFSGPSCEPTHRAADARL